MKPEPDSRTLINAVLYDGKRFYRNGFLKFRNGLIEEVGSMEDWNSDAAASRKEAVEDLEGRLLLPGLFNPHTHLYSSLAAGLSPAGKLSSFRDILEKLWWPLDQSHDEETIYCSALKGVLDAVKYGVTCIADHHASMNNIAGSLEAVERAFSLAGIKGILCYEISDRAGPNKLEDMVHENIHLYRRAAASERLQGTLGLHANFTLSDNSYNVIRNILSSEDLLDEQGCPLPAVHIHCGEDAVDLAFCRESGYSGPVDRLNRHGLFTPRSLLVHGLHLSEKDYNLIHQIKPFVIANTLSNANNRVGCFDRDGLAPYSLGTDGLGTDMIANLRAHHLMDTATEETLDQLAHSFFGENRRLLQSFFPDTGELTPGFRADLAVLNYIPVTPISAENIMAHLVFGAPAGPVFLTVAEGRILFREGRLTFTFEKELRRRITAAAEKLHQTYYAGGAI